ncbi:CD3337/EF1877 family mobilome membrane protein [Enterococcus faecalis]|uniref:CD3337/EF1877 family mobilome membrane protein n=1 Tax=Enterococcus faecalis TaxID=1351 RepID=UPI0012E1805F|nr:FUSC family protein [Enterococcus faecalis]EGO5016461.1 FUSC family protein [Enterococcus faecalis]EGO7561158.1 FUSC family protein [Enterococcus faecalis]EGO7742847.1 FUSC family protein [Enterococcus faecalis]EGO8387390.1 FUSC family protein [Enterococcus faecalis]EIP7780845.1 FUSC family protein [Enterococcus faecalis]
MQKKKIKKWLLLLLACIVGIFLLLLTLDVTVHAAGLVDETINPTNEFSKYPVNNYQLDYFVDSSWDWLPWNWGDGVGKTVMYGIYAITNFIWLISVYLSYATGYLVNEAYSLDFIKDTSESIGKNMQTLAGISENGFSTSGFFPGLLLILILVLGIYVTYTGLLKKESTKAINALINFVVIFLLSASFIAYSTSYISKINEFSSDMSNAALAVGSKMMLPDSSTTGKESVNAIRDSLFEIQVKQPWLLLQYGNSDSKEIGEDRVTKLVETSPWAEKGKTRTELVKKEIEEKENDNLTITKTINRLGMVVFLFLFNIGITLFVFILTGIMIFSQILFIIYAIFFPISCLLAMIPSFNHLMKTSLLRLFNVIMMRAGITLVITIAFSLSSMVYALSASAPFFLTAFLQVVIFAGIYFKLNDLMGMMALSSSDSQGASNRMMRRPRRMMNRTFSRFAIGGLALKGLGFGRKQASSENEKAPTSLTKPTSIRKPVIQNSSLTKAQRAGQTVGAALDTKKSFLAKGTIAKENVQHFPTTAHYALAKTKNGLIHSVTDFKESIQETQKNRQQERVSEKIKRRQTIAEKRAQLQKKSVSTPNTHPTRSLRTIHLNRPSLENNPKKADKAPTFIKPEFSFENQTRKSLKNRKPTTKIEKLAYKPKGNEVRRK